MSWDDDVKYVMRIISMYDTTTGTSGGRNQVNAVELLFTWLLMNLKHQAIEWLKL